MEDHLYFGLCCQITLVRPPLSRSNLRHADLGEDIQQARWWGHPLGTRVRTPALYSFRRRPTCGLGVYFTHDSCWVPKCIVQWKLICIKNEISIFFLFFPVKCDTSCKCMKCHILLGKIRKIFQNIVCWKFYPAGKVFKGNYCIYSKVWNRKTQTV